MKLTPKQKAFVKEYLVDLNATQAAIRAGYSEKTAAEIGRQNLIKLEIQEAIQKEMKKREERTEITQDRVLEELGILGFSNIKDYMEHEASDKKFIMFKDINKIPDDKAKAIEAIKVNYEKGTIEFKLHSKTKTLEMIGRHLAMFTDNVAHSGEMKLKHALSIKDMKEIIEIYKKNAS